MHVTAVLFDLGGTLFGYERREEMSRPTLLAIVDRANGRTSTG